MPTHTPVDTETCFDCPAFCDWWDAAYAHSEADPYRSGIMGCPDDGWALYALVSFYNEGFQPAAAVDEIVEGYDPTP